jgi:DNA-binding GntR family transcriptional regulator
MYTLQDGYGSLSSDLLSGLRGRILQSHYKDGEKLSEQQICDEFHVSRTPVREALRQLESEGLVRIYPNRGAYVSGFSAQDLRDLYAMRRELETLAAGWAAERIRPDQLEALQESLDLMSFYTEKIEPDKMMKVNMRFHSLIHLASQNRRLANVLAIYQTFLTESKANHHYLEAHLVPVQEEHRGIYQAIADGRADEARALMYKHLEGATHRAFDDK